MNTPSWRQRLIHTLPGQLLRPLSLLPRPFTQQGFVLLCNQFFSVALAADELDFLDRRVLCIALDDAGIALSLSLTDKRLRSINAQQPADVTIRGTTYDLMLMMSQQEDADTLFFQRRLRLEGDTELGLHLKNFLDAWEPPASVRLLQQITATGVSWAERFMEADRRAPLIQPDRTNIHRRDRSA